MIKNTINSRQIYTKYTSWCITSPKSDFYFLFHSPLNTNSALLNFICIWDLLLICWKMWSPQPETCRNRNPHTSEIGKLLPVCLTITNSSSRTDLFTRDRRKNWLLGLSNASDRLKRNKNGDNIRPCRAPLILTLTNILNAYYAMHSCWWLYQYPSRPNPMYR